MRHVTVELNELSLPNTYKSTSSVSPVMLTRYSTPGDTPREYTLALARATVSIAGTPTVSCLSVTRGRVTSMLLHDSATAASIMVAAMAEGCRGRAVMPSSVGKSCDNLTRRHFGGSDPANWVATPIHLARAVSVTNPFGF